MKKVLFLMLFIILIASGCQNGTVNNEFDTSRCEEVPESFVKRIESGINTQSIILRNAKAVKSNDFESVYFISADLQGPSLEGDNDIATFATNKMDYNGSIFSADAVADEFFDWPLGSSTDFNISMVNNGAEESRKCVNNN